MTNEANMLLRSAYAIAIRDGVGTNWKAFAESLKKELLRQACLPAGLPSDVYDEQTVLRVTCTPRTYRSVVD